MTVLWIRNFSAYNDSMTSHALGGLACSRRTLEWRVDVMAVILKVCMTSNRKSESANRRTNSSLEKQSAKFHSDRI